MLALATKVLNDYSKVLASIEPANLGFSESFLPHSKTAIREATKTALTHLGRTQPELREALLRGYVYLEQFVSDQDAEILMQAASPMLDREAQDMDFDSGAQASAIVSRIKLQMEIALKEISQFGL
jgi:hypothetical protein